MSLSGIKSNPYDRATKEKPDVKAKATGLTGSLMFGLGKDFV